MAQLPTSGIPLFRLFGIQVFLHWSWIVVAVFEIQNRKGNYSSQAWNIAEYLALFGIVLTHEFGHALACRSVGGKADRIMLWPLGGVAFVQPPFRPGAILWSIAAGPLVNVLLVPVTFALLFYSGASAAWTNDAPMTDLQNFLFALFAINAVLLIFNMLPIYPLDGGQILWSILWFFIGPIRSLLVATVIGLIGAGVGMAWALSRGDIWLIVMAAFAAMQSWAGFQRAQAMRARSQSTYPPPPPPNQP